MSCCTELVDNRKRALYPVPREDFFPVRQSSFMNPRLLKSPGKAWVEFRGERVSIQGADCRKKNAASKIFRVKATRFSLKKTTNI